MSSRGVGVRARFERARDHGRGERRRLRRLAHRPARPARRQRPRPGRESVRPLLRHSPARRAGGRPRTRRRRRRPGDRARGRRPRHPGGALESGVGPDGARRGRGRRRPALVPAVLEHRPTSWSRASCGRAEAIGAQAIVVTLDTQMLGWRPRDLDRAYPAVHPRHGHRAVHVRPGLPPHWSPNASRPGATGASPPAAEGASDARRPIRTLARHDPPSPRTVRRQPALRRAARGRGDLPRRVLAIESAVVRSRVPAGAHEAADPAQGHPASG